ncbi:25179_t:CDS:2, partial [Gigaspora rosea]
MADESTSTLEGESLAQNTSTTPTFDPILLKDYLNKLLPLALEAEEAELEASLWSTPENITEQLHRFANDAQVSALYITKAKEDKKEEDDPITDKFVYTIAPEI